MFIRVPHHDPLAHSSSRLALLLRSERGTKLVELGDRVVTALVIIAAALIAWFLFATLYLVMRDDYVVSSLASERRAAYVYEDRVVDLRQRIDQITARQLLNQDSVEVRVASLIARQAELEARQMAVGDLQSRADRADIDVPSSYLPPSAPQPLAKSGHKPGKPQPLPASNLSSGGFAPLAPPTSVLGMVENIEERANVLELQQNRQVKTISKAAEAELGRTRQLVAAIGLSPERFGKNAFSMPTLKAPAPLDSLMLRDVSQESESAVGGPLLPPVPGAQAAEDFEFEVQRVEKALDGAKHVQSILRALPVGRPMPERYTQTSGFGTRSDPFLRSLAMHSGIDFRAPTGTPVGARAAGRIVHAGSMGGYGRMVEIDHGFGITTRYGHLSAIDVNEGDTVKKGEIIGAVGSTGRSTGPHLHYEVRIDEDATDPTRFIRAARIARLNG